MKKVMQTISSQLHKNRGIARRALCVLLAVAVAGSVLFVPKITSEAVIKKDPMLKLLDAKAIAISKNDKIESLEIQVATKNAAMQSAIKSLREKQRNMSTVRWSPLLSIKFPTKPNEEEAFTFQFKPVQMQYQINILEHKINDTKLDTYEAVSNTYIDIITSQQEIKYDTDRLKKLNDTYEKLKAKQAEGRATKSDVTKAEVKVENLTTKLSNAKAKNLRSREKLSQQCGYDLTSGYRFEDAFVTANLGRDFIPLLQQRALEKDQGVYEATIAEQEALLALRTNYSLMSNQYGGYMSLINAYVEQALIGTSINKKAFKAAYDNFVKKIDEKWQGHYKIWFIKIPKEWLKGDLDGVRYIEDDPYVLYTAALEYETARKELENTKKELKNAIEEGYDGYAEARKAYLTLNKQYIKAQRNLASDQVKNLLGELSDDEFQTEEQEVTDMQSELNTALSTYSTTLYSYDRLTCGAVSQYLKGEGTGDDPESGMSSVIQKGITYTIRPVVASQEFLLSLNIPDDFEATNDMHITHFALYSDGRQIGNRTMVGDSLRHLVLTTEDVGKVSIRLYNGNTFLTESEIDPTVYIGDLKIVTGYQDEETKHKIGNYTLTDDLSTDMITLTFDLDQDQVRAEYVNGNNAVSYNITTDTGAYLISDAKIPVENSLSYLSLIKTNLPELTFHMYDENEEEIGTAIFSTTKKELIHDVDEKEWTRIREEKEEKAKQQKIEEEKQAEEEAANARAERAKAALQELGYEPTEENMKYALEHLRELEYAAETKKENASIDKTYAKTEEMLKMAKEQGQSAEEIAALEKRLKIMKGTQQSQQKTLNENSTLNNLKNMNK